MILAAGPETAKYLTIFRLATAYKLLIMEFSKIIINYQLKFQMIINTVYFDIRCMKPSIKDVRKEGEGVFVKSGRLGRGVWGNADVR